MKNYLLITYKCFECEDIVDACELVEPFLDDEESVTHLDFTKAEFPVNFSKFPIDLDGEYYTPTFFSIKGDSLVKAFATELFPGDLGFIEGFFNIEIPLFEAKRKLWLWEDET